MAIDLNQFTKSQLKAEMKTLEQEEEQLFIEKSRIFQEIKEAENNLADLQDQNDPRIADYQRAIEDANYRLAAGGYEEKKDRECRNKEI